MIGVFDPYRLASCLPRRLGAARVCGWAASVAGDRHAVRQFYGQPGALLVLGIHGDPVVVISLDIADGVVQTVRAIATPRSFGTSVRASIYAAPGRDPRRPEEPPDRYRPDRRRASGGERGAASARPVTRLGGRADRGGRPRRHGDAGLRHRPVPALRSPIGLTSCSTHVIAGGTAERRCIPDKPLCFASVGASNANSPVPSASSWTSDETRISAPRAYPQQATGPGHRYSMRKMQGLIRSHGVIERSLALAFS